MAISTAIAPSARARAVGVQANFKNLRPAGTAQLPQRIAVVGQGATASTYDTDKIQLSSAFDVGTQFGFGSPLHLAAQQLFPANGAGVGTIPVTFYPLEDDASGVAATADITPSGTPTVAASYRVLINNISSDEFVIEVGDVVADVTAKITAAINAILDVPVVAVDSTTKVDLTSKWKGTSANDLYVEVVGSTTAGNSFAITQPNGGLVNPDVDDALNQVGDVWETLFLNCMEYDDTTTLDKFSTFGEGRWGATVKKPMAAFGGNFEAAVGMATSISDARKTDRTNGQLVSPGSVDLPFVIAARQLAVIAVVADSNPPTNYDRQSATGLIPGADSDQWTFAERDEAIKKGLSSVQIVDGVVQIADVVTFYHPSGDQTPAYQYLVDVVKLQNIIFNTDLIFNSPEWAGAPLIPDDQATTNVNAKQPKMAVAAVASMIDALGLSAIISGPENAKATIVAGINETNPKRLDVSFTVQLSGNVSIVSVDLNFGFFFGTAPVVA